MPRELIQIRVELVNSLETFAKDLVLRETLASLRKTCTVTKIHTLDLGEVAWMKTRTPDLRVEEVIPEIGTTDRLTEDHQTDTPITQAQEASIGRDK